MATRPAFQHTNRLANEKSPYLLQHAHNPVDWYPWGNEAFAVAQRENKPIFLSVGYSTCHWCHVMEHESFENERTAVIMNEHFVNIKVDRETHPNVDRTYMTFVQATQGGGGWPMSVFLTPELKPFFGGTYYPPEDHFNRPGFPSLLLKISEMWRKDSDKMRKAGANIMEQLKTSTMRHGSTSTAQLRPQVAHDAVRKFQSSFDSTHGGFGGPPKFPTPVIFHFLYCYHAFYGPPASLLDADQLRKLKPGQLKQIGDKYEVVLGVSEKEHAIESLKSHLQKLADTAQKALSMANYTLERISNGGIHDHVGKGFHRYSVDEEWHVPHFEKMLYDQAQLLAAFLDGYQASHNPEFAQAARDILEYVQRDLSHTSGGFYSAQDADSLPRFGDTTKQEGAFCVWERSEIDALLGDDAAMFAFHYDVQPNGNVNPRQDIHGELQNKNVLRVVHTLEETAREFGIPSTEQVADILERCKEELAKFRAEHRPPPHLDDKIVTCWNGLMVSACAKASHSIGHESSLAMAEKTVRFVRDKMYLPQEGVLIRSYREEPSDVQGFVDDYAFFIQGLLDMYTATFDESYLEWAVELQSTQDRLFWDSQDGGYFNVASDDHQALLRLKEEHDGAEPSPNSVAVANLVRLHYLLGNADYRDKAERTLEYFAPQLVKYPQTMPYLVASSLLHLKTMKQIVISGKKDDPRVVEMVEAIRQKLIPNLALAVVQPGGYLSKQSETIQSILEQRGEDALPTAYICENFTCGLPIRDVDTLVAKLAV